MSSIAQEHSQKHDLHQKNTALLVESKDGTLSPLKTLLEKKGFHPVFTNAENCLKTIDNQAFPRLHILDISDKSLPPDELLKKIQSIHPATCIIATDEHSYSNACELLAKGAYALVRTPVNPKELEHLIDRHCEHMSMYQEHSKTQSCIAALQEAITALLVTPKKLAKCLYLSDFGRALMTEFQQTLNASGGSFFILEGNKLLRVYSLDPGHVPEEITLPLSQNSLLGQAHEQRELILVKDLHAEKAGEPSGWEGYTDNSTLVLPLTYNHDHVLGFISLHNKKEASFTEHDAAVGSALASIGSGILSTLKELFASQERENQFRRFFLDTPAANAIIAPDSTILLANPAFESLLGILLSEGNVSFSPFMDSTDSWDKLVLKLKQEHHLSQHELRIHLKNHTTICVLGSITARLRPDSSILSIHVSLADITEKRRLEHELSHSLKMEAVGRLAGGVAHDFNNLIAVILGYSEILIESLKNTTFQNDIREIKQAGEKAAELAKQLCYFSRKQIERQSVINVNDSVTEMERMLRRLLGENIILYTEFNTQQALIIADKGQIEQVIMNLVINARDAMPRGGTISIITAEQPADSGNADSPGGITLTVADSGTGMSEEVKAHIFDPFFSTKEQGKGTGLGLATVHAIVQTAGGKIIVESVPGRGTSFMLSFPKASVLPKNGTAVAESGLSMAGTEHILLLEDDKNVRTLMIKLLAWQGYSVKEASNSREALLLFNQHEQETPFDLFIADVIVPGITGKETAELMRKKRPSLPVLFISGYSDETLRKKGCADDYSTNFITKPFDNDTLQRKVREILDTAKEHIP
ncbi:MAG: response regulator [Spirochaetales bacterium]|nr:response regulator [Spirochaetales bacterium]